MSDAACQELPVGAVREPPSAFSSSLVGRLVPEATSEAVIGGCFVAENAPRNDTFGINQQYQASAGHLPYVKLNPL